MSDNSMPNPLSADFTKDSPEFGLKTIKACYNQWKNGNGSESWAVRKKRFDYNRAFARGKQPMEEYKDIVNVEGQLAVINLDYTPLPIAIPIINKLKDRYNQRIEKITCNSIDPFTQSKKKKAKDDALFKLKNKDKILALQEMAGTQLEEFSENDPEDEQEIDIEFGHHYKVAEEILMQNLIDIVFYDNRFTDVEKDMLFNHIINCGYAITETYIDGNGRIKVRIVKPENFITSYSEWNDFRDWQWQGEVYPMSIQEIRLSYPGKIGEEKLFALAKDNAGKNGNTEWDQNWTYSERLAQPYDNFSVLVTKLCYKTLYNLTYEKNVDRFGKELLDKVTKFKEGKEYEKSKPYYVSYTGCWIVDTEYLLEWGLSKNMIKPEENLVEIYSPYTVYMYDNDKMTNTPLMETMIPSIKMMQNLHLQAQKIIASTAPDGATIDVTGLSDLDMGDGVGIMSPMQLYSIYLQTGDRYFKGIEDSGEGGQRQPPITPTQNPISNKLEQLDMKWQREYDKLLMLVGSNAIAQGDITNQAIGKQVLQDAKQIGESSSNYVYNTFLNVLRGTARRSQMLGWDILVYGKKGYKGYRLALGEDKVEYLELESTDDFEKTQFDVKIEAVIDNYEQERLQQKVDISLNQKEITLQDAIDVERLAKYNIKYAAQILAARLRKREKQRIKEAQLNSQANTEQAIAAAEAKSNGEMQLETLKSELASKARLEELESLKQSEIIKFASIAKVEIIKSTLSKEGATTAMIPEWIMEGVGMVNEVQSALMAENMQDIEQQAIEEQQIAQEEQMMAEQEMQQQQVA